MPRFRCAVLSALAVGVSLSACGLAPLSAPGAAAGAGPPPPGLPPSLIVAPDDGTAAIVNAISTARRSVLMEMYMLTAPAALTALLNARNAGCQVHVLLEPAPYGAAAANQAAFSTLTAAGIDVRWFSVPTGLVHSKFLVIDGVTAYILTLNLTVAGLGGNREYAMIDSDPADVRWGSAIWNADAVGANPGAAPADTRLLASPLNARARLAEAIEAARVSIAIETEEISDTDLVARLVDARARGLDVTVVAPAGHQSVGTTAALFRMAAGGILVRELAVPPVHAKAMVIDARRIYVGSVNFTRASLDDNREIGILFDDSVGAARIAAIIASDASRGRAPGG